MDQVSLSPIGKAKEVWELDLSEVCSGGFVLKYMFNINILYCCFLEVFKDKFGAVILYCGYIYMYYNDCVGMWWEKVSESKDFTLKSCFKHRHLV